MNYLVVWSGGYDEPSYFGTNDLAQATSTFEKWSKDVKDGDLVQLLDLTGDTVSVLNDAYIEPASL